MFLQLYDTLKVGDVQDRFNECFPNLRLAFYTNPHKTFEASDKATEYHEACLVGDIRKIHNNTPYEIKSWYTTERVERELKDLYGLNAQILRLDGNNHIWVQTTLSDNLTLMQQSSYCIDNIPAAANQ